MDSPPDYPDDDNPHSSTLSSASSSSILTSNGQIASTTARSAMHIPLITTLTSHLLPFLAPTPTPGSEIVTFTPRHAHSHAFSNHSQPTLLFHNGSSTQSFLSIPDTSSFTTQALSDHYLDHPLPHIASAPLSIRTKRMTIRRPRVRPPTILSWAYSARNSRIPNDSRLPLPLSTNRTEHTWVAPDYGDDHGEWEDVEVVAPDVTDRQTLISMAKMTSNAYVLPDSGEWWPIKGYNASIPFGWEPDADGLRGHVVSRPVRRLTVPRLMR